MTPDAALETSDRLLVGASQAKGQQIQEERGAEGESRYSGRLRQDPGAASHQQPGSLPNSETFRPRIPQHRRHARADRKLGRNNVGHRLHFSDLAETANYRAYCPFALLILIVRERPQSRGEHGVAGFGRPGCPIVSGDRAGAVPWFPSDRLPGCPGGAATQGTPDDRQGRGQVGPPPAKQDRLACGARPDRRGTAH